MKKFPDSNTLTLSWSNRKKLIKSIISSEKDLLSKDIICLYEVDKAESLIKFLQNAYHIFYTQKNGLIFQKEGILMAFDKNKFVLKEKSVRNYLDEKDKMD